MQPIFKGRSLWIGDTVAWINSLHPLSRERVAVRIAPDHVDIVVLRQCKLCRIIAALHSQADVHADYRVVWVCIEQKNLLEFAHRVFLTLFVKATCTTLGDHWVPIRPLCNSYCNFWRRQKFFDFQAFWEKIMNLNSFNKIILGGRIFDFKGGDWVM
jgi:hypothetical protein